MPRESITMKLRMCIRSVAALLLILATWGIAADRLVWDNLPAVHPSANDWPWWCGTQRDNIAPAPQTPPVRWSAAENVIWKTDVPGRGHGSPCIWGDRIFLPTADDRTETQSLFCYNRKEGKPLWQTELHRGALVKQHGKNSHASATPACDGQFVFMTFVIQNAIWLDALDLDGRIVWQKRLGDFHSMHGFAASPLIHRSLVIVEADSVENSFLVALHRRTGEVIWKVDRPSYRLGTYASPTLGRVAGREQLLVHGPNKVFSHDPASGALLWSCDGPSESASSTMTFGEKLVYSSVGFPKRNLLCIRADGSGDVTQTHVAWSKEGGMAYVPSLLLADGLLYMVEDAGKAVCFEADTGKVVWETKLDGKFSSSPVLAGGRIYVVSEKGVMFVFKPGREFALEAANDLGDGGFASPIILGGRIYLRTLRSLYCLGKP